MMPAGTCPRDGASPAPACGLVRFHHEAIPDALFDVVSDPDELDNRAGSEPSVCRRLAAERERGWAPDRVAADFADRHRQAGSRFRSWAASPPASSPGEFWSPPEACLGLPESVV